MKKATNILTYILLIIVLIKTISMFIFPIPIECRLKVLDRFIDLIYPLSLAGLSAILIFKQINNRFKIKYLLITVGVIGLILSFLLVMLINFWSGTVYEDKFVAFQSTENKRVRIIQQYMDEGALGSHWREVRVKDFCCGFRYSDRFCETTLNGLWLKYDYKTGDVDTLKFDNYIYKSEINSGQNWTTKKCN